jgi:sigma-B regulation protein RsbU (phosphoserine phosphatase)
MTYKHSVLIVDDDPVALALLKAVCEEQGMRVYATQTPEQAYSIALSGEFQIVIADWEMPGMLGIELCAAVRQHKFSSYIYFILVSAHEGSKYLQTALDAEVDQFLPKPLHVSDLKHTLNQAAEFIEMQLNHDLLDQQLPNTRKHVEFDMAVLRQIQTEMMPKHLQKLGKSTVHMYNKPYSILSGDQCGVFEHDEHTFGFFLLDVVGHGFHAAVQAFNISSLILREHSDRIIYKKCGVEGQARVLRSPGEVLSYLNAIQQGPEDEGLHVCAVYGLYNSQTRQLQLSLAGMPQPYVLRPSGELFKLGTPDLPLGLFPNIEYATYAIQVEHGDQLLLMSDGLSEVQRGDYEVWGAAGVEMAIQESGLHKISPLGRFILSRAKKWAGTTWDQVFDDDVTLLGFDLDSIHESESPLEAEIHAQLQSNPEFSSTQLRLHKAQPEQLIAEPAVPPVSDMEARFRAKTALRHARIQETVQKKTSLLQTLRDEIRSDMERVALRQAASLPGPLPEFPNLSTDWIFKPAYMVSGDFLGLFKVSDREVGFLSIDALGQGVLSMIHAWLVFRILTNRSSLDSSPAAKLKSLNHELVSLKYSQKVGCSGIYGVLNTQTGLVRMANAAHPAGILIQSDGHCDLIHPTGPRLGEDVNSKYQEVEFYLKQGQRLHLYSDGLYQTLYPHLAKEDCYDRLREVFTLFIDDKPELMKSMLEKSLGEATPERRRDVSMLVLELALTEKVAFSSMTVVELLDKYHPLMPSAYSSQGLPLSGRVYKLPANQHRLDQQIQHVHAYISGYCADQDVVNNLKRMILRYAHSINTTHAEFAIVVYIGAIVLLTTQQTQILDHNLQVLDWAA